MSEVDKLCTYVITSTSDFNSQILGDEKNLFWYSNINIKYWNWTLSTFDYSNLNFISFFQKKISILTCWKKSIKKSIKISQL